MALRVRVGANQCGNRKREGKAVGFRVTGGFAVVCAFPNRKSSAPRDAELKGTTTKQAFAQPDAVVRLGSAADIWQRPMDVCSTPESGRWFSKIRRPFRAVSRH